jgi:outer membrane protein TolC
MLERSWMVAALLATCGVCTTASAEVVPLATLEKQALEKHASLRQGAARERAAAAEVRQAQSGYKPRIGMNLETNIAPGRQLIEIQSGKDRVIVQGVSALDSDTKDDSQVSPFLPQWRSGLDLTVGANVYDFGRTHAAVAASRAKLSATKADQKLTRVEIVSQVRGAYLAWLSADALSDMAQTASSDAERRSHRVNALVDEGVRARSEFSPVEADRLLAQLELERSNGELEATRIQLEQVVGITLAHDAEPDPSVLELQPTQIAPSAQDPALQVLTSQGEALRAQARVQRKQRAPVVSFSAGTGIRFQFGKVLQPASADNPETPLDESLAGLKDDRRGTWLPSYAVGLSMAIPLWDGGGASASADATEARADELRIQLESAEQQRNQARERARLDAEHAQKREATALKLLEVCKTRVADTEAGYELGAMQFEQVQQARALLRRAETEIVLARVSRAEAILRIAPVGD